MLEKKGLVDRHESWTLIIPNDKKNLVIDINWDHWKLETAKKLNIKIISHCLFTANLLKNTRYNQKIQEFLHSHICKDNVLEETYKLVPGGFITVLDKYSKVFHKIVIEYNLKVYNYLLSWTDKVKIKKFRNICLGNTHLHTLEIKRLGTSFIDRVPCLVFDKNDKDQASILLKKYFGIKESKK